MQPVSMTEYSNNVITTFSNPLRIAVKRKILRLVVQLNCARILVVVLVTLGGVNL